jgi:hypothetical protein
LILKIIATTKPKHLRIGNVLFYGAKIRTIQHFSQSTAKKRPTDVPKQENPDQSQDFQEPKTKIYETFYL